MCVLFLHQILLWSVAMAFKKGNDTHSISELASCSPGPPFRRRKISVRAAITEDIPDTPVPHLNSGISWAESCRADFVTTPVIFV